MENFLVTIETFLVTILIQETASKLLASSGIERCRLWILANSKTNAETALAPGQTANFANNFGIIQKGNHCSIVASWQKTKMVKSRYQTNLKDDEDNTPPKAKMEPQNAGLEDDFPFQTGDFQVPC